MTEISQPKSPAGVLLQRRDIRRSFLSWCLAALSFRGEAPARHHRLIINVLEQVTRGEVKNVIFLMPPGSAKSTYTSILFPPWYLNVHPHNLILACSYSYSLIEGFGRQCRDLIDLHQNELGYSLSKTAAAAGDWRISTGGGYFCAGVGSGIAGHRADLGFIDDYLGSEEDADSDTIREKQYKWYRNDFWPRLKPNAAQIIIANRRHEDDLVGRLLEEEPEKWLVIRLPMLAEENDPLGRAEGERLWPEWFTEEMVLTAQKISRTWAGLYQQRPAPEEGDYFKKDWIVPYGPADLAAIEERGLRYYVGADYAVRKDTTNDRFCFLPVGVDSSDRTWVLPDWFWCRADTGEAVEAQIEMSKRLKPICWWAGRENITGAIEPFLFKRMREEKCYIPVVELSESKDKQAKAQSIKGRMSQKMVLFPTYAPGWEKALNELLTFPGGTYDDFVDALSKIGQGLGIMTPASTTGVDPEGTPDGQWEKPTFGWIKKSHNRLEHHKRIQLLDK